MRLYLLLGLFLVGAIAPSLAAPNSTLRPLRFVFVLAVYPLFVAIALGHGVEEAGFLWFGLAGLTLLLQLAADRLVPPKDRSSLLNTAWKAPLFWPLVLPAVLEALLVHGGLAPATPPESLPEPPRGDELFTLSDDELLIAAHQILGGQSELTDAEQTLWLAETFSREIHGGGLSQWFSNSDSSVPDTVQALRAVGAGETAGILLRASEVASSIPALDAELFSQESRENLTTLNARFVRENRSRCPSLMLFLLLLGCADPGDEVLRDHILFEGAGVVRATSTDGVQRFIVPTGPDLSGAYTPSVSPDGRRIVFSGVRLNQVDLYVMNADGTGRRQITNDIGHEFYPRWSPDGSSLLFTWSPVPNNPPTSMVIMDPDGRNRREVLADGWAGDWSPDGRSIAFTGIGARGPGIYVLDIGGGTVASLPDVCGTICEGVAPRWSPDGQFLAFTYLRTVGGNSVVLARPNGADARMLLPDWETYSPVWAPDGQRLALARFESLSRMYVVSLATLETVSLSPVEANEFPSDWAR